MPDAEAPQNDDNLPPKGTGNGHERGWNFGDVVYAAFAFFIVWFWFIGVTGIIKKSLSL